MSVQGSIYQRGDFYLDCPRGKGGKPSSSRLYIFWYDSTAGRLQRKSTGTADAKLASKALDRLYLARTNPSDAERQAYTVGEAIADYWNEVGSTRTSAAAIGARLKTFLRFLSAEVASGRLVDPILPAQIDNQVIVRFRAWGLADPIRTEKGGDNGEKTYSLRPRMASTVEESVVALKAAFNHAVPKRLASAPLLKHLTRDAVTVERSYRLSVDQLAQLLDLTATGAGNYKGHADRLLPLRRYLIAAISTMARPDAILDMSVDATRAQWYPEAKVLNLNPAGRIPTRKRRPTLPVPPMLTNWLERTDGKFVCRELTRKDVDGSEWIEQMPVASIKSSWQTLALQLNIPPGWGPKLIRYSVATILAARRVDLTELEIALGHRVLKKTTGKYAVFDPGYLITIREGVTNLWLDLEQRCKYPLHANLTQADVEGRRRRLRETAYIWEENGGRGKD